MVFHEHSIERFRERQYLNWEMKIRLVFQMISEDELNLFAQFPQSFVRQMYVIPPRANESSVGE